MIRSSAHPAPAAPHWRAALPGLLLSLLLSLLAAVASPAARADDSQPWLTLGAGVQRMASWLGSRTQRNAALPYLDIEGPHHVSLSTVDGLQVDLIHARQWHGGIYGDYQWGRSREDLGPLAGKVPSLSPRLNAGGYVEWDITPSVDVGSQLTHDTHGAGAYFNLYAEWDLPPLGLLEHSFELRWQAMNSAAMDRFFGIRPSEALQLGSRPWDPDSGSELASLEYDLFVPTSRHTGFALGLVYGRLFGNAGNSPLVTRFGSRTQMSESLAFVYHR
jgi:outer membrane scaffolding protein for murein synthesis (MipA/OmpV family)